MKSLEPWYTSDALGLIQSFVTEKRESFEDGDSTPFDGWYFGIIQLLCDYAKMVFGNELPKCLYQMIWAKQLEEIKIIQYIKDQIAVELEDTSLVFGMAQLAYDRAEISDASHESDMADRLITSDRLEAYNQIEWHETKNSARVGRVISVDRQTEEKDCIPFSHVKVRDYAAGCVDAIVERVGKPCRRILVDYALSSPTDINQLAPLIKQTLPALIAAAVIIKTTKIYLPNDAAGKMATWLLSVPALRAQPVKPRVNPLFIATNHKSVQLRQGMENTYSGMMRFLSHPNPFYVCTLV